MKYHHSLLMIQFITNFVKEKFYFDHYKIKIHELLYGNIYNVFVIFIYS